MIAFYICFQVKLIKRTTKQKKIKRKKQVCILMAMFHFSLMWLKLHSSIKYICICAWVCNQIRVKGSFGQSMIWKWFPEKKIKIMTIEWRDCSFFLVLSVQNQIFCLMHWAWVHAQAIRGKELTNEISQWPKYYVQYRSLKSSCLRSLLSNIHDSTRKNNFRNN